MEKLRILLLGPPGIYLDDQPIQIQRKTARMLLYFLACQSEPVSRAELSLLFWIDENEEDSRRHLREILSKLKSELPDPTILIVKQDLVSLDQSRLYVDVNEFSKLYIQIRGVAERFNADTPLPLPTYQKMVQAVELWRGQRFLAGINMPDSEGLDHWLLTTSERLETSRQYMIDRLADHSTAAGDLEAAVRWLRQAITIDETNESTHYRLVKCLTSLGWHNQAVVHCNYMRKIFQLDGNDGLPPALEELCQETLLLISPQNNAEKSVWHSPPVIQSPYVGQKNALAELSRMFQRGGTAVIFGEAGAGKTRLIYEFTQGLQPSPRLLVAQGRPLESRLPFQPLTDMLRRSIRDEEWKKLEEVWLAQFLRLLPELAISNLDFNLISLSTGEETRTLLFEALLQLLTMIAKTRRLILFLEDAQWVDEATLAALAYLVERRFFRRHGLLILAVRPEEINLSLENFISYARTADGSIQAIPVEHLSLNETSDLAHYILGEDVPSEITQRLAKETGGNPFILVESLRALLEYSNSSDINKLQTHLPIAGSIHSLVRSRLLLLNPQARQLVATAAIIGNEFTVSLLESASGLPPEKVAAALDEMESYRLIQPVSDSGSGIGYLFPHQKMREAILLELSMARKRLLHQRVALELEKDQGTNNSKAYSLAQHFEAAGEIHKAFHYWQETAKYACQMLSKVQTFDSIKNAENIFKKHPSEFSDEEIYRFYSLWCDIAAEDFEDPEYLQRAAATLQRIGEQRRNPLLVGSGLNWQGVVELIHQNGPRGLELLSLARPYLEQVGELFELVNNKNTYGLLLLITNQGNEAHALLEESIKLADGSLIPRVMKAQINALDQLALAYNMQGRPLKGRDHAQKALHKSNLFFLSQKVFFSQNMIALADYFLGEYKKGLELCKAVIKKEEEMPVWHWAVFNYHILTRCEIELGMLDSALEHINKAIQINEPYQRPDFLSSGFMLLGTIHQVLSDAEGAISYFHKGINAGGGRNFQTLENYYHLGESLLQSGSREEGYDILKQTAEQARAAGLPSIYIPAEARYLQKEASGSGLLRDSSGITALLAEAEERSLGGITAFTQKAAVEISLLSGAPDAAYEIALSAVKCARQISCPWVELQSLALLQRLQPDPHNAIRIQELLGSIGEHTKSDELRPLFEKFKEETLVALI